MTLDATADIPATGPISVDQAAALLAEKSQPAEATEVAEENAPAEAAPEGAPAEQETEADPQSADGGDGEEDPNPDAEDVDEQEPAEPAIEPPRFWDAEGKEEFAKLPRAAQQAVAAYEEQRAKVVDKALREAATVRKGYEAKQAQLQLRSEQIGAFITRDEQRLQQWHEWFSSSEAAQMRQSNPQEFIQHEDRYHEDREALAQMISHQQKLEAARFEAFRAEQEALLPTLVPELAGREAPKVKAALRDYLSGYGEGKAFDPDRLNGLSAYEAQIAFKAMRFDELAKAYESKGGVEALMRDAERYRKAEALAKKPPPPKPKAPAGPNAAAAGQGQRPSSDETRFRQLNKNARLSEDEAIELFMLRQKLRK